MKTEKLFWQNTYLKEFTANILSTGVYEKDPTKSFIVLDKTAFYPEGGGQPWDEGKIGNSNVSYVYEEEEIIYHVVDQALIEKENIFCSIDWGRRFDFMQQHLGQHILSRVFEELYDANTVGFHLGNDFVTIDINKPSLSFEEIQLVEEKANKVIYDNLEVVSLFPTKDEVLQLPLRKQPTVEDGIRIVKIDEIDYSPCAGTHPKNTGSVGIIKIRKWEKNKSNLRIEFICGSRALEDFYWKNIQINEVSNLLSVKDIETQDAVTRLYQEHRELNKTLKSLKKSLLDYRVKELHLSAREAGGYFLVVKEFEGEDFKDIKTIASALSLYPNTVALLGTKIDKAQVVFSCSKEVPINMNQLFKEVIPLINGKGGGNATSAQGGGDEAYNLESLLKAAEQKIIMEYIK
ncbi:alanyl-tRNA synthetase AlaS [Clostridium aceticum]|uniref:Alanine--tRNA ligase n=1 Tax=Clostridium aceticum TaxID=84022 RepID=A0A0D8I5Y3_9CLOT|nr:DHHA1 domain-containing protein [Clostridium aceticum]AKL95843.1 alanyl-tRNA synthetase AlaS [Clostridium aceticum]KJF25459.1 hypothetical protein TZ02_18610 [Clostridium aceticum]